MIAAQTLDEGSIPQPLLPIQLLELLYRRHSLEGERLLAFTVLRDALNCYLRPFDSSDRGRKLFRKAKGWIDRRGERSLFSFDHVCDTLAIEPNYLRNGLHRYKEQARLASFHGHPGRNTHRAGTNPMSSIGAFDAAVDCGARGA